jgi:methanogenic corrinoid protein MtbC1
LETPESVNMGAFDKTKKDSQKLPPISEDAVTSFGRSLPRLVFLVNEKFEVENRFCCGKPLDAHMDMLGNIHRNFSDTLLAVYRFHIYDTLVDEFVWLVSTLHYRGFDQEYFEKMLDAWIVAIHGTIEPSFSNQLAQPFSFLKHNLPIFLQHAEIPVEVLSEALKEFVNLLLVKKRRDAAEFIMSQLEKGSRPDDLCTTLIMPALKQIGLLWQKNQLNVADEHAATEICRYIIFRLCDSIPRKKVLDYKALVSCVPGEEHQLGAEILSSHLESEGWTVYYLGHSTPEKDNLAVISKHKPDVVFFTATLVSNLPQTVDFSKKLRETAPGTKIILGGQASVLAADKIQMFADAIIEDYREAHLIAKRLLSRNA